MSEKAIILLSGGLDSLLTLAIAIQEQFQPFPLHLNYGQKTQIKEENAFFDIIKYYNIKQKFITNIDYLKQIGNSSLTDSAINSDADYTNDIPNTYIPFRNANILAIATA